MPMKEPHLSSLEAENRELRRRLAVALAERDKLREELTEGRPTVTVELDAELAERIDRGAWSRSDEAALAERPEVLRQVRAAIRKDKEQ